jgi:ketosteroid isomerase-like protein
MSPALSRYRAFLDALERFASPAEVAQFWADDARFVELPNALVPRGRTRTRAQALDGVAASSKVLTAQRFEIVSAVEQGERLALELDWRGTLAIPIGNTAAGGELHARIAAIVTLRDGLVCAQTNYDCYDPF